MTSNTHVVKVSNSFLLDEHFTIAVFHAVHTFWRYLNEWAQKTCLLFPCHQSVEIWPQYVDNSSIHFVKSTALGIVYGDIVEGSCQTYTKFSFLPQLMKKTHENKKIVCVVQRIWGNKMVHMPVSLIVKYNFIFSFFPQNLVLEIPFANICNKFTDLHYILS